MKKEKVNKGRPLRTAQKLGVWKVKVNLEGGVKIPIPTFDIWKADESRTAVSDRPIASGKLGRSERHPPLLSTSNWERGHAKYSFPR